MHKLEESLFTYLHIKKKRKRKKETLTLDFMIYYDHM